MTSDDRDQPRQEKRDRVLDAAEALLREGGAGALSMRALAQRADVGHVTPYHLFDSKHGVMLALLSRATATHLVSITQASSTDDPVRDVLDRQRRLLDLLARDEEYSRAALSALDDSTPPGERARWLEFVSARSADDLERLIATGVLRPDTPVDLVSRMLLLGRDGAVRRWFRGLSSFERLRADYLAVTVSTLLAVATDEGRSRLWDELTDLAQPNPGESAHADKETP